MREPNLDASALLCPERIRLLVPRVFSWDEMEFPFNASRESDGIPFKDTLGFRITSVVAGGCSESDPPAVSALL